MGEDIHQRVFVKSRKAGCYLNAHDICEWNTEYSVFKELAPGRNYDLFSLFGSRRGNYKELSRANYGMPEFLAGSLFDQYCEKYGYYGFVWWKLPDLKAAVCEYIESLKDPLKYFDEDDDEYSDFADLLAPGIKSSDAMSKLFLACQRWSEEHRAMLWNLEEILAKLERYEELKGDERKGYSGIGDLIDVDETLFLFFFDN